MSLVLCSLVSWWGQKVAENTADWLDMRPSTMFLTCLGDALLEEGMEGGKDKQKERRE